MAIVLMSALLAATLLGAYGGAISPRVSVLPAMACMAYPGLIVATAVAGIAFAFLYRPLAFAAAAVFAICLPTTLAICPMHISGSTFWKNYREHLSTDTFTVMTYNAFYFNSRVSPDLDSTAADATAIAILEADPSIVVLQEGMPYDPFEIGQRKVSNAVSRAIRERYPYRFFSASSMGIMSKYPFVRRQVPYDDVDESSFLLDRFDMEIGDSVLQVLDTHLQSLMIPKSELRAKLSPRLLLSSPGAIADACRTIIPRLKRAFINRASQARTVRRIVDRLGSSNMVVCGDFNDVPTCYAVRTIKGSDMTDCYTASALGPTFTYRAHRLYFRIDQMICGKSLKPLATRRVSAGESDHYPIITAFAWR